MQQSSMFSYPKQDLVAGTVVFLVAVPLCLGIAIACGVPPISGLVAGIAGGLIVPWISRSPLSVTGPAAGLTSIVLVEVSHLGLNAFLTAVIIAGGLQVLFGVLRAGGASALVPSAVIKGMLAAIGITIVWKQLPVAFGVIDGGLAQVASSSYLGPMTIAAVSLLVLYTWRSTPFARYPFLPAALVVVVLGSVLAAVFTAMPGFALAPAHFVNVPLGGPAELLAALPRPDFAAFAAAGTWIAGITIALVASIETLLSVQAVDRLDPLKRQSPPNRELLAQGAANTLSGFFGGLPVTAVIVRSGANVAAGGRERLSALFHGLLLLVAVLAAGPLLNQIPLAALAAVLIQVGLNLCKPALFATQARLGVTQLVPFAVTIAAVLALDLLKGVIIGILVGVAFVLFENSRHAIVAARDASGVLRMRFRRDGTFVSKPGIISKLEQIPDGDEVVIDGTGEYIDHDVKEVLATFIDDAKRRAVKVTLVGIDLGLAKPGGAH